ncbi:MAG TPA: Fe-S cluster assembly protein SufD [bacterium]|nr:Fe-S cluster assembly protein SufD [bacterium]
MATNFQEQFDKERPVAGPAFWQKLRREGLERFSALGFPTRRMEEWKYTGVQDIAEGEFRLAKDKELANFTLEEMHRLAFSILPGPRLVFLNGFFHPVLSDLSGLPAGVKVKSLAQALLEEPSRIEAVLGSRVKVKNRAFAALNAAFLSDGAFICLSPNTEVKAPIQLLFVSRSNGQATISHPRVLIQAEAGSKASVIETYVGAGSYFTNAVTEILVGEGAQLEHVKLQGESEAAFHVASIAVHQDRDSRYANHSISLGAALARHDIETVLDAEGAFGALNGLYMVTGKQHVDHHTNIEHAKPHGGSAELYKGILDGQSQAVFDGRILVQPDAQQTSSQQTNKNLLLSDEALVNTKPLLEIFANDVKCSHGATIGRLDENQVFYLRSRGIEQTLARSLLTYAFASDLLAALPHEPLRERLKGLIFSRLMPGKEAA